MRGWAHRTYLQFGLLDRKEPQSGPEGQGDSGLRSAESLYGAIFLGVGAEALLGDTSLYHSPWAHEVRFPSLPCTLVWPWYCVPAREMWVAKRHTPFPGLVEKLP